MEKYNKILAKKGEKQREGEDGRGKWKRWRRAGQHALSLDTILERAGCEVGDSVIRD
jgi:hypothetical protein